MKWTLIATLTALAGCAMTPDDVREQGTRHAIHSAAKPETAARCIGRNAEKQRAEWSAHTRPAADAGAFETVVRIGVHGVMLIADLMPDASGSRGVVRVQPNYIFSHEDLVKDLMAGC